MTDPATAPATGATASQTAPAAPQPADPRPFQLRGNPPRVMRLSRKALAVMGIVAGLGIGGSLIYALRPPGEKSTQELYSTGSKATAETITSGPKDYSQVPKLGSPLPGDLGGPIVSARQRGENVPVPPVGAQPDLRAQAAEAARQRAQQERDAARTASLFLGGSTSGGTAAPPMMGAAPNSAIPAQADSTASQGDQTTKRAFMAQASSQRTVSAERLTAPPSPNIVQAGSIIPAALITGIRSDLPGQITAQVTANVYDSPTGRILLIPQGARLIGEYDSEIAAGQTRVLLAWDRLILPDGRSIVLERQPGTDAAGFAGLQDRVNQHWGNMLKAAAISTLLGVGTELAADSDDDLVRALRRGTQDSISQTGQQTVRRQLNVPPTLTIRAGHPLRVVLTRDLVLESIGATR
ncbi:conjugal transfer protein TraI [Sphingobium jiangsuense]|uniref:Type IV secretion system protein VirB10 n=1 Tax=Sphingobium jiangsuense TaxID=870476 RepID=A0A7W6BG74_9SPHN|nr:TrbI/VirB10 family protein [Sphingobium jiangsuense]MBB3926371.1 type IV secretion system protein VirB10 [Sphingobium jiangsuense]QEH81013.1 TrbI/VirB10 family protein [Sphingomonas sp. C8-2]GLS99087.1 conjugal transfer protein TraI [Sphingobium jiangsuense]